MLDRGSDPSGSTATVDPSESVSAVRSRRAPAPAPVGLRILFVPTYYYTHYDVLVRLGGALRQLGAETIWLHVENSTSLSETDEYSARRIGCDGFQYRQIHFRRLTDFPFVSSPFVRRFIRLYERWNRYGLAAKRPDGLARRTFDAMRRQLGRAFPASLRASCRNGVKRGLSRARQVAQRARTAAYRTLHKSIHFIGRPFPPSWRRAGRRAAQAAVEFLRLLLALVCAFAFRMSTALRAAIVRRMPLGLRRAIRRRVEELRAWKRMARGDSTEVSGRGRAATMARLPWRLVRAALRVLSTPLRMAYRLVLGKLRRLLEILLSHARFVLVDRRARHCLQGILRDQRIDCVIVGSHLGGRAVLVLQDACRFADIPVVSIWKSYDRLRPHEVARPTRLQRLLCRYYGTRTLYLPAHYDADIMRRHVFIGLDEMVSNHLRGLGVPRDQVITAPPSARGPQKSDAPRGTLDDLQARRRGPIVFVTEALQELRGDAYLRHILDDLRETAARLDPGVSIVIRFHPREPDWVRDAYRSTLPGSRFRFESPPLHEQIDGASCMIASFSAVANEALLAGCPVFLTQFRDEDNLLLAGFPALGELRCGSPAELAAKLTAYRQAQSLAAIGDAIHRFQLEHYNEASLNATPRQFAAQLLRLVERQAAVGRDT